MTDEQLDKLIAKRKKANALTETKVEDSIIEELYSEINNEIGQPSISKSEVEAIRGFKI